MEDSGNRFSIGEKSDVCHDAIMFAMNCFDSNTAVPKDDHLKERTKELEFKIYWPRQLQELRLSRGISDREIMRELGERLYPATLKDQPRKCLYTERKRLIVRELSLPEMTVLKAIVGRYVGYMTENPQSFLQEIFCVVRISDVAKAGLFHIRNQSNYTYIAMTSTVLPQLSHEILHTFLLSASKSVSPKRAYTYGALTNDDFSLDHELAMHPKERKAALDLLERDVNFLQSLNLQKYCILYSITTRNKDYALQLPGAPYGPEVDTTIDLERKDTIPFRHDIPYGAFATPAQLLPIPYSNYEFIER